MGKFKSYILLALLSIGNISCSLNLPRPHSLKFSKETFTPLAEQIIEQKEIFEMDDFMRYHKSVNDVWIRLQKDPVDKFDYSMPLDSAIAILKLQKSSLLSLREGLEKTKLRQFYKSSDSIVFIVDGFLNDSWGYFYSSMPLNNDSNSFKFGPSNVRFVEKVDPNWKKVSIH